MAIQSIEDSKTLRKYGLKIGRQGIAQEVIAICKKVADEENYIESIKALGELHALALACKFDDYWDEKRTVGFYRRIEKAESEIIEKREPWHEGVEEQKLLEKMLDNF